jgi:hypothetical protein
MLWSCHRTHPLKRPGCRSRLSTGFIAMPKRDGSRGQAMTTTAAACWRLRTGRRPSCFSGALVVNLRKCALPRLRSGLGSRARPPVAGQGRSSRSPVFVYCAPRAVEARPAHNARAPVVEIPTKTPLPCPLLRTTRPESNAILTNFNGYRIPLWGSIRIFYDSFARAA